MKGYFQILKGFPFCRTHRSTHLQGSIGSIFPMNQNSHYGKNKTPYIIMAKRGEQ